MTSICSSFSPSLSSPPSPLSPFSLSPPQSSMDDYTDMPINAFGAAMLKGMGWKPGEAIGLNKKGSVLATPTLTPTQ